MANILGTEKAVILFLAAFVVYLVATIQGALWFIPDRLGIIIFLGLLIGIWLNFHVWRQRNMTFSSRATFRKNAQT